MVKTFATALVCGTFFVAYASAQEVFVGDQHAKPKFPKAEPVTNHVTSAAQADKPAAKPANVAAAKSEPTVKVVSDQKSAKTTVAKAAPAVVPGQRAPSA